MNTSVVTPRLRMACALVFSFATCSFAQLGDAVDNPGLTWDTEAVAGENWTRQTGVTHDGVDAARSGASVGNADDSAMWTTVTGPGTVSFWWKVSCQEFSGGYGDMVYFFIDSSPQFWISGEVGWEYRTVPVAAGTHSLTWSYMKDVSSSAGSDCAWVDQVVWTPSGGDTTPPGEVSDFAAVPGDGKVDLSWTNPSDADFDGVRVQRKVAGSPSDETDGSTVYDGTGTSATDTGLSNGTRYFYKAFTYDEVPNYSAGAGGWAIPRAMTWGGPLTGVVGRAMIDQLLADFSGTHIDFDSLAVGTALDTELQTSHGVTFWTTTDTSGNPLGTPHNVRVTTHIHAISPPNVIVGTPSPGAGDDGRNTYEIRFVTPQQWAGVERVSSAWYANSFTKFYCPTGGLLGVVNSHPEQFAGYISRSSDSNDWISVIECTGTGGQVGYTDDLIFGVGLPGMPPGAPTALMPTGTITDTVRPVFSWTEVANATWYNLSIQRNGSAYHSTWVETTTWTGQTDFVEAAYTWKVRAWNPHGFSPWSGEQTFTLPLLKPAATTLIGPSGELTSNPPTFAWQAVQYATRYHLWIQKDGTYYDDVWINPAITYTPPTALPDGNYPWWVQPEGLHGLGPWSASMSFTCGVPLLPGMSQPLAPTGIVTTTTPIFEWSRVGNASEYRIWIRKDGVDYADLRVDYEEDGWNLADEMNRPFGPGNYQWWIQTANPMGNGPWSGAATFTVQLGTPTAPVPVAPVGAIYGPGTVPSSFEWTGNPETAWVRLLIQRDNVTVLDRWLSCFGENVDVWGYGSTSHVFAIDDISFDTGAYTWWVGEWQPGFATRWNNPAAAFVLQACSNPPPAVLDVVVNGEFEPLQGHGYTHCPRPRVLWNTCPDATWYHLQILQSNTVHVSQWIEGHDMNSWIPATDLAPGSYGVRVRAWNSCGLGPWSSTIGYVVDYDAPGAISNLTLRLVGNKGMINADVVPNTYWYHVIVVRNGVPFLDRWFDLATDDDASDDGRIEWLLTPSLSAGNYGVWMSSWNGRGPGPWAGKVAMTVDPFPKPALFAPTGTVSTYNPEFHWENVAEAEAYRIFLRRGNVTYLDEVLEVSDEMIAYDESEQASTYAEVGIAQGWKGDLAFWTLPLGFDFPFFGTVYTQAFVNSNGGITFDKGEEDTWWQGVEPVFPGVAGIAVLWNDLTTEATGDDIYVLSGGTSATIRWKAHYYWDSNATVNISATLHDDGRIQVKYGSGNQYGGGIGLSAGDYTHYNTDGVGAMGHADDILLTPRDDMGGVIPWDLPEGAYRWWIQVQRANGTDTAWSDPADFVIDVP